ncbi:MAG: hypothetical protein K2M90_01500 [Treponemataceae bacterium]|nr:hypothetical protein [Treponemataceae bacterium]MDE7391129.1 hypothetical protein [Treponemataceae bacterium]
MNMKKKSIVTIAALALCAMAVSCKKADKADTPMAAEQSLYERGLALASEVYECAASKELLDFMMYDTGWETIQSEGEAVKESEPTACYELRPDYESFIALATEEADWYESLSPAARKRAEQNLPSSIFNYNGNVRGVTYLVLGTVLTATALFDSIELQASTTYLYVFKSSYPVLVTFTKGEGNAILANASLVFAENLINASSAETVTETLFTNPFYHLDCSVTQVR